MTTVQILTDELWPTITRLARSSRRTHVAVAFLGGGASKLLPLKAGDSLVVDMSPMTVRSGQTNPSEVGKYVDKGVHVYNCPNLHAKVFLFDNTLIVGSSNVSQHSRNDLIEAGSLSKDRDLASEVKGWMQDLSFEPVYSKYVHFCKKIYNPPSFRPGPRPRGRIVPHHSPLWVLALIPTDYTEEENMMNDREVKRLGRKLENPRKSTVTSVRLSAGSRFATRCAVGDLVLQLWSDGPKTEVYPPCRLVSKRPFAKTSRVFVYFDEPRDPRTLTWRQFHNAVLRVPGGKNISENSEREITSNEARHAILGLWA